MTLANIKFRRTTLSEEEARYLVETPDFTGGSDEVVAEVLINLRQEIYQFSPKGAWENKKLIPLDFFEKSEEERRWLLEHEYQEHSCAPWTGLIHRIAMRMINNNKFPEFAYGAV